MAGMAPGKDKADAHTAHTAHNPDTPTTIERLLPMTTQERIVLVMIRQKPKANRMDLVRATGYSPDIVETAIRGLLKKKEIRAETQFSDLAIEHHS